MTSKEVRGSAVSGLLTGLTLRYYGKANLHVFISWRDHKFSCTLPALLFYSRMIVEYGHSNVDVAQHSNLSRIGKLSCG